MYGNNYPSQQSAGLFTARPSQFGTGQGSVYGSSAAQVLTSSPFSSQIGVEQFGGGRSGFTGQPSNFGPQAYDPYLGQVSGATQTWSNYQGPLPYGSEKPFNVLPFRPYEINDQQQGGFDRNNVSSTQARIWEGVTANTLRGGNRNNSALADWVRAANTAPTQQAQQPGGGQSQQAQSLAQRSLQQQLGGQTNPFAAAPGAGARGQSLFQQTRPESQGYGPGLETLFDEEDPLQTRAASLGAQQSPYSSGRALSQGTGLGGAGLYSSGTALSQGGAMQQQQQPSAADEFEALAQQGFALGDQPSLLGAGPSLTSANPFADETAIANPQLAQTIAQGGLPGAEGQAFGNQQFRNAGMSNYAYGGQQQQRRQSGLGGYGQQRRQSGNVGYGQTRRQSANNNNNNRRQTYQQQQGGYGLNRRQSRNQLQGFGQQQLQNQQQQQGGGAYLGEIGREPFFTTNNFQRQAYGGY